MLVKLMLVTHWLFEPPSSVPLAKVHRVEWEKVMKGDPVEINPSLGSGFRVMTVGEWAARWKQNADFPACLACKSESTKEHYFTQTWCRSAIEMHHSSPLKNKHTFFPYKERAHRKIPNCTANFTKISKSTPLWISHSPIYLKPFISGAARCGSQRVSA